MMKNSVKIQINEWTKESLTAFIQHYTQESRYPKLTHIVPEWLVNFNTLRLFEKQGSQTQCLTFSSGIDNAFAIGYAGIDSSLSRVGEKPVCFARCFLNKKEIQIDSLSSIAIEIDKVCKKLKAYTCRIKCDNFSGVPTAFREQGFTHYCSTEKLIYRQDVSYIDPHKRVAISIHIKTLKPSNSATLDILLDHKTSERYNHPYIYTDSISTYYQKWWKSKINDHNTLILQAISADNKPLALAIISKPSYIQKITNIPLYTLDFLYTYPAYRKKGIGEQFLTSIIKKLSPAIIETSCSTHNTNIIGLLQKCNFQKCESYIFFAKAYNSAIPDNP